MTDSSPKLPRILVFSEGSLTKNHGTGAIFLRNFAAFPQDHLCNAFIGSAEGRPLPRSIDLNTARWPDSLGEHLAALPARVANRLQPSRWRTLPASRERIALALKAVPFQPDLIYAICWGGEGLTTLVAVLAAFPRVPLLMHFHDLWPSVCTNFVPLLRAIQPRLSAAWAVSPAIARFVTRATGHPCEVDPIFHIELPAICKSVHRPAGADFQTIIIGNFWNDALLADVKAIWRSVETKLPWIRPLRWYAAPESVARLRSAGFSPEPEISPAGFLRGEELWEMLTLADLSLIPFSRDAEPTTDYERYSLPSRLTELAAAGLPIFGLTGQSTPLAEYLTERGIGLYAPASATQTVSQALHDLIIDAKQRERLGRQARAVAEREFPLAAYQRELYGKLSAVAFPTRQ
jgi:hypothetical protein